MNADHFVAAFGSERRHRHLLRFTAPRLPRRDARLIRISERRFGGSEISVERFLSSPRRSERRVRALLATIGLLNVPRWVRFLDTFYGTPPGVYASGTTQLIQERQFSTRLAVLSQSDSCLIESIIQR